MKLKNKKAAILVEDLYNDFEVWVPYYRLKEEGVLVHVIGSGTASTYHGKYGVPISADKCAKEVRGKDFDLVIIPGGYAPDRMRIHPEMVQLVREAAENGKILASICHGGWMLASANVVRGKRLTSYVAIKDDLVNAGALWEDSEMVQDGALITSRKPEDLPAFCRAIIQSMSSL